MFLIRNIKLILLTAVIVTVSQFSSAQVVQNTFDIVPQIEKVDSVVSELGRDLKPSLPEQEINKRLLQDVKSFNTFPLEALPDVLTISGSATNQAWTEVRVEDNWRAIKNQWIVLADETTKRTLVILGASIDSERLYAGLNLTLLRFTVPEQLDSKQALANHLTQSALETLDRNHIYQAQSIQDNSESTPGRASAMQLQGASSISTQINGAFCADDLRIGMIDSAVDRGHPVLSNSKVSSKSFLVGGVKSPTLHGTAVASVLLGKFENKKPLLGNAHLYSAEVLYRQSDYAQGASLNAIIDAMNWLLEEEVMVINMSLAGPANSILKAVIGAANKQGAYIVAAAGNEGPAAPAVYPAGYEDVVAVSAIDEHQKAYRWSNQGPYIDYAALGVNVVTAQSQQRIGRESGTSMAAPVVSAALVCILAKLAENSVPARAEVMDMLSAKALDLGPKGRDPIYGIGVIQANKL
ncbi:MAG: minor extracellular protease Epr [Glaciecola sp.]|jgi:minor extracellular protease Epr